MMDPIDFPPHERDEAERFAQQLADAGKKLVYVLMRSNGWHRVQDNVPVAGGYVTFRPKSAH